ncbi:MAG: thermonuclease family protein [Actinomycetota bacterium]|nr:thermonuclease family protein [Actinomycetota bacterium]
MVRSITDGDTFVLTDGRRVRLAQVDAPETSECFGTESTGALSALAAGKTVTLRRPPSGPATDRYGRTLADVRVGEVSVNEAMVRSGGAEWYESFAKEDADLAERLRVAENEAKAARRGLWSACGRPAPAASPSTTAPTTTERMATAGSDCHPGYPDDCIPPPPPDLDCPDIARRVRVDHRFGDPHGFDRDEDGWGCESYG